MIPFNDFSKEPGELKQEIHQAIERVVNSGWFILGKELEAFEAAFADYIGTRFCLGVASGTEAIALTLMAYDIGQGDEVITTNLTAYPTITGILQSGAQPVVVDIFSENGLIDYTKIEAKITSRTAAIMPVHLYGQSCQMDAVKAIASRNNLILIEDCAQAAGATFKNRKCGSLGDCGAFSFYPTKNLGAYGDGGAITTNDETVYKKLLSLRNYGQTKKYYHESKGINSRLDEMQAAILHTKLKYLDEFNIERRQIAKTYQDGLQTVECLAQESYGTPCYHLFVVKTSRRDELAEYLKANEIQTLIHYPIPVNRQKAFQGQKDEILENSFEFADSILSLPIYPGLAKKDIDQIIQTVNEFKP
jgi:dTDP-4-amino-4,6-dideoxygalactose transaminase